jgi:hypothetical protein
VNEETFLAQQKLAERNRKRHVQEQKNRDERKAATTKRKVNGKQKAGDSNIDLSEDEDTSCGPKAAPSTKKQKITEPSTKKITAYIHIQAPTSTSCQPSSLRSKSKKDPPQTQIKGPCFFSTNDTYNQFKEIVAKALPCKLKLLPADKMYWKYEKPMNDPKKPLLNINGYEAIKFTLIY